jgi:cation:H+ antiporter
MISRLAAAHALSGLVSAALMAVVALGILTGPALGDYVVLRMSPAVIMLVIAYGLGVRLVFLDQQIAARAAAAHRLHEPSQAQAMSLGKALAGFAVCAVVVLIAGPYLAEAAGELAEQTGLGQTFVGTTLVALSTSLPELVSMIAALRMGAADLAIGNVFGSNAFNMILLAPLDLAQRESLFAVVSQRNAVTCIAAVLATQVAVMGQLYRSESRTRFIEPDAWLVIVIVLGGLALIYYLP